MAQRYYVAVLERGDQATYGVWFPDFPGAVAAARTQEDAMARAEEVLAQAVHTLAEQDRALPEPTPIDEIAAPDGCEVVAFFAVRADLPNPSERVNVYLPKSLIERADRRASELGMSRSSFFGLALTQALWNGGSASPFLALGAVKAGGKRR